ncbi:MAG: hypothetical protein KC468_38255 [Myxococcales bacterium]|nr:hypothetical protein [Myxococcales bacterium]
MGDFTRVRAILTRKPSAATWRALANAISKWKGAEPLESEVIPYCVEQLAGWPARIKRAPPDSWVWSWRRGRDLHLLQLIPAGDGSRYELETERMYSNAGDAWELEYPTVALERVKAIVREHREAIEVHAGPAGLSLYTLQRATPPLVLHVYWHDVPITTFSPLPAITLEGDEHVLRVYPDTTGYYRVLRVSVRATQEAALTVVDDGLLLHKRREPVAGPLAEFVGFGVERPYRLDPLDLESQWPHGLQGARSRGAVTCPVYARSPSKFRAFLKADAHRLAMHGVPAGWRGEIPLDAWFDTKYRAYYEEYRERVG